MAETLRLAEVADGDIALSDAGRHFVELEPDGRKTLFAQHLQAYVLLAQHIRRVLEERRTHAAPACRFRDELEGHMAARHADQTLRAVTPWGR